MADLLAELGAAPHETLVVIPIGPEPFPILTHPLPKPGDPVTIEVITAVVAAEVRAYPSTRSVFMVTFCTGDFFRPHAEVQEAVQARLHEDDIHLMASFYVSSLGYGTYYCDHPECAGPRDLRELHGGTPFERVPN